MNRDTKVGKWRKHTCSGRLIGGPHACSIVDSTRFHLAMAATMVFNQFKVYYALLDHPDLEMQVQIRKERMYVL